MNNKECEAIGFIVCIIFAILCFGVVATIIGNPDKVTGISYWWFLIVFSAAVIFCVGSAITLWKRLRQPW